MANGLKQYHVAIKLLIIKGFTKPLFKLEIKEISVIFFFAINSIVLISRYDIFEQKLIFSE